MKFHNKILTFSLLLISIFVISCTGYRIHPEFVAVNDEETACKIAEIIFTQEGGINLNNRKPLEAKLVNDEYWVVKAALPDSDKKFLIIGESYYIHIRKKDCKILELYKN